MRKSKSKKKQKVKAGPLLSKIITICNAITTIAKAAEGVHWIYQHAWPHVEPLFQSGLFCPERFWWDSLVLPMQSGESPTKIRSHLVETLKTLRADQEHIEDKLAHYSDTDRQRIADAYAKVLSAVQGQYPDLVR